MSRLVAIEELACADKAGSLTQNKLTLAILIFDIYPLTAVMIVMLALLNDGAI